MNASDSKKQVMNRHSKTRRRGLVMLLVALCSFVSFADPPGVVKFTSQDFVLTPTRTNVLRAVVFRDLNTQIVAQAAVATQIMARFKRYSAMVLPNLNCFPHAASNALPSVAGLPNLQLIPGSADSMNPFGRFSLPNASARAAWVQALPVKTNIVSCVATTDVAYLEYVDCLSRCLELRTGVLTNGDLIFGTDGHWPTNFVPRYTIELKVRNGQ